jgi:hypothetical protein
LTDMYDRARNAGVSYGMAVALETGFLKK